MKETASTMPSHTKTAATATAGAACTATNQKCEQPSENRDVAAVEIAGGRHQRHRAVAHHLAQLGQCRRTLRCRQFLGIAGGKRVEPLGLVRIPAAQLRGRGDLRHPSAHPWITLAETTRPQAVDEHPHTVVGPGIGVDARDVDAWTTGHAVES
jgi:hypothetical protein